MNMKLLIVDDDLPFRERLSRSMEKKGFEVDSRPGFKDSIKMTFEWLKGLKSLFMFEVDKKDVMGPIGIAKISGSSLDRGFASIIFLMAVLSINLGLINLFPIPVLDGGHLVLYLLEFIRGRPLGQKAQEAVSFTGLGIVIALMIFVTLNDIWPGFWSNIGLS